MGYVSNLDTPLLQLSAQDQFTLREACQGIHVFGGVGSGKTSMGATLAAAYLRAGMGGLVLAAKSDEVERWLGYAQANGRASSVIRFGEAGGGFNFLDYELARQGDDGVGSVIECLMRVLEASRQVSSTARSGEAFWEDTTRQLLRNTIPVLRSATGTVRIPEIIRFVASAPTSLDQLRDPDWQSRSFMFQSLVAARTRPMRPMDQADLLQTADYWHDEYSQLDPKTRGNIAISLSTALDRFNRGRLKRAFCEDTNLVPELTFHGAIIIMDMSALTWNDDGIIGQQLFKYMWQRAVLARNALEPRHRDRPVFLWCDEAHIFANGSDNLYQSTCRSARACTVYLSQSLPTYYATMGGENAKHRTDQLLANFTAKLFMSNSCPETNRWAADTIGRSLQRRGNASEGRSYGSSMGMNEGENSSWGSNTSWGSSSDGRGNHSSNSSSGSNRGGGENFGRNRGLNDGSSHTSGFSETMDYEIEAAEFSRVLRTGGPANGGLVTGVWFQAGKTFCDSNRNYLLTTFTQ
jgi:hypothetical protein